MLVFLAVFLSIYGAEHFYIYRRLALLPGLAPWLAGAFLLLIPLPILATILLRSGSLRPAQILGWIGFGWMGFAFLLFSALLLADLVRLSAWLVSRAGLAGIRPDPVLLVRLALAVAIVLGCLALWNARRLQVNELTIQDTRLAPVGRPLRVLQISDLHLGMLSDEARVARVVERARSLKPDLVLCTGDLVDGPHALISAQAALLAGLEAPLGKYAVTGNHEAYATGDGGLQTLQAAGFRLLRNEGARVLPGLSLAGIDDPTYIGRGDPARRLEADLLAALPDSDFRILLKHQPILSPASRWPGGTATLRTHPRRARSSPSAC
jgi:hypothetical protein